jgi:hypothetical protein
MLSSQYAAERDLAEKTLRANVAARASRMDMLVRYAEGRQYEGRPSFWDGSVPLFRRAPCVVYAAPAMAAHSFVALLLGDDRFCGLTSHPGENDAAFDEAFGLDETDSATLDRFIESMLRRGHVMRSLRALLYRSLVAGCAVAVGSMRYGTPALSTLPAEWCTADRGADGQVIMLEVLYPQIEDETAADGSKHPVCMLYRRVIDGTTDTTYLPTRALLDGTRPEEWRVDQERTVEHGFGFCPVVWYANRHESNDLVADSGRAIHDLVLDELDGLNFALSVRHRAAMMLGDPMIVEIGVDKDYQQAPQSSVWRSAHMGPGDHPDNYRWGRWEQSGATGTMKGPGTTWRYESPQTKVDILTLPSGALDPLVKNADDLLATVAESMAWVPTDAKQLNLGTAPSGRAFEWLHKKQIDRCLELREDFGEDCILACVGMLLRMVLATPAARVRLGGVGEVQAILGRFLVAVEGGFDWVPPEFKCKWGPFFPPTEADMKLVSEAARADLLAGIITKRTAVERLAPFYAIKNVDQYLEALEGEAAEREGALEGALRNLQRANAEEAEDEGERVAAPAVAKPVPPRRATVEVGVVRGRTRAAVGG